jgi:hypothetical protein
MSPRAGVELLGLHNFNMENAGLQGFAKILNSGLVCLQRLLITGKPDNVHFERMLTGHKGQHCLA